MIILIIVLLVLGFTGICIVAYDEYKKEVETDKVSFDCDGNCQECHYREEEIKEKDVNR